MSTAVFSPPTNQEFAEYYQKYIDKVTGDDFLSTFEKQGSALRDALGDLPPGEVDRLHAPYTWTLRQLMGHLIDCERIFSTRMLRIAAGDKTPLPGFDQDACVANMDYENVTMDELLDEFNYLRRANVLLAKRLTPQSLQHMGIASDHPVSARANLYILAGHVVYHLEIIKRRLGLA
jgi:uncharacterized damage-inducible protein DinB